MDNIISKLNSYQCTFLVQLLLLFFLNFTFFFAITMSKQNITQFSWNGQNFAMKRTKLKNGP